MEKTIFHQVHKSFPWLLVGNMMQSVVLDGNPLNGDEDVRLLTCVVSDGNPPDVLSLKGNPLDEDDDNLLDEVVLERICS